MDTSESPASMSTPLSLYDSDFCGDARALAYGDVSGSMASLNFSTTTWWPPDNERVWSKFVT